MEDVEQEAGAARPGAHDAPDAVAAHDTIDTAEAHAAKAAATAAPKRPKSAEEIMRLVEDKAAAEEGAPQGGSVGGGSQKTAAEGEHLGVWDCYTRLLPCLHCTTPISVRGNHLPESPSGP